MNIGMLVGPGYEDLEFWAVYMRIMEEGADIKVMGLAAGESYASKSGGLTVKAEYGPGDIGSDDIDALLIPGGWAPDKLRRVPEYISLIQELDKQEKVIGFICHAGWLAASAEILTGRKAVGSTAIRDDMVHAGAVWNDEAAFVEGNLVWGRVVADIPDYNRLLVDTLAKRSRQPERSPSASA
ncbi:MAG: DJ-1/PfpI family protein [Spirochaetales bacterium]|nr:DJ-1/PfpI family protein [Spirochaetales bacterium]